MSGHLHLRLRHTSRDGRRGLQRLVDARSIQIFPDLEHSRGLCEDDFVMGILDDNTLNILRDGRVIDTMHRLSERNPDGAAERGVKLDVRVRDKHGAERTKKVILKKVR